MAITDAELSAIERALQGRPDGLSMSDLVGADAPEAKRRTMRTRLAKLIKAGRATSQGERRWTRYYAPEYQLPLAHVLQPPPDSTVIYADAGVAILLSPASREIRRLVQRPEIERQPIGYQRRFLGIYQPNHSAYLPEDVRAHLQGMGTVNAQSQPAGTYARNILDRLLIDLSWSSSKLEGNTYSLLDTKTLIEQGKEAEGKTAEETAMILNHKNAIEFMVDAADDIGFNRYTLLNLHSLLADGLIDAGSAGRLREHGVGIGGSVYTPLDNPHVIEECFNEILAKADAIQNPFEQSFFASVHLPYLQPFADVNKRVSRLAANIPFIKRNLAPVTFIDVPKEFYVDAMLGVYELNRVDLAVDMFVWAYERSARQYTAIQQKFGGPDAFKLKYREQLRNLVSEIIRGRLSRAAAVTLIDRFTAQQVPRGDHRAFIDAASAELVGLHEGNFARYKVRPSEFYAWKGVWEG